MTRFAIVMAFTCAVSAWADGRKAADKEDPAATVQQEELDAIRKNLSALGQPQTLIGESLRITGLQGGFPVTHPIGPWQIDIVKTDRNGVMELKGIKIGSERSVQIDFNKGLLLIDGESFIGRSIKGKTPVLKGAPFQGAVFQRTKGMIVGKASVLVTEDGRIIMDYYKVTIREHRGEYGILSPSKVK